jgi:hypothetical protein
MISDGDASIPDDLSGPASGTISWLDGDGDPKWIEYSIVDDGFSEPTEFFEVTLNNAVGAAVAGSGTIRLNIENGTGLNQAPTAVAGTSQTVSAGAQVALNGGASNDPNGDVLAFAWAQTAGPQVTLSNATTATARFTAPSVASDTLLQFRLTVRDPGGLSSSATTAVTVLAGGNGGGGSGGGTMGLPLLLLFGLFALAASRRDDAV